MFSCCNTATRLSCAALTLSPSGTCDDLPAPGLSTDSTLNARSAATPARKFTAIRWLPIPLIQTITGASGSVEPAIAYEAVKLLVGEREGQ